MDWTAGPMFEAIVLVSGGDVQVREASICSFQTCSALLCCERDLRAFGMSEQGNQ